MYFLRSIILTIVLSIISSTAMAQNLFRISEYDINGNQLMSFGRNTRGDEVFSINAFEGRYYTTVTSNDPDKIGVDIYSSNGQYLHSITDSEWRNPYQMTRDSSGNIYVSVVAGSTQPQNKIYKFDATENLALIFGERGNAYRDVSAINNSLFVAASGDDARFNILDDSMTEYDFDGNLLNEFGPTTTSFLYEDIAFSQLDNTIFVNIRGNGSSGSDLITQYDIDGNLLNSINLNSLLNDAQLNVQGLEVNSLGNLFFFENFSKEFIEVSMNGQLVRRFGINLPGEFITDFTLTDRGTLLLTEQVLDSTAAIPEPTTMLLFGAGMVGAAFRRMKMT